MSFTLETNTLVLEMNEFNTPVRSSATPTHQLATGCFHTELMSWWLLVTATHPPKWVLWHVLQRAKRYLNSQWRLWLHVNWSSRPSKWRYIVELLFTHDWLLASSSQPVTHVLAVVELPDYTGHTRNHWTEAPEVNEQECDASLRQFQSHNLPVVAHTKLKTSKMIAISRAMIWYTLYSHTPYRFLVMHDKGKRKKEKEKKKKERNWTKLKFLCWFAQDW